METRSNQHTSIEPNDPYCNSLTAYSRFKTREVKIGDVALGGDKPIRVQSMTTTDTMDTAATVAQSIRMIEAGCEYVRITAPSLKEARNLENIKQELRAQGYTTPLIADIHFTPNAAELAARIVEKVRVNPGNYADKKKFQLIEYSDAQYEAEIERIAERFTPLVRICKEYGTAMRIGTNHGSLSDRIMSRYGDTPLGMVESAMEFLRICRAENYHDIVLSMKASNTQVMVQAYRLLVATMLKEGMNYPLHLGVTEAGDGEDGRTKSAVGIGTLLEDGLGDTVRVSLTEEPEAEIPVARALVERYTNRKDHAPIPALKQLPYDPYVYSRRESITVGSFGGANVPRVIADLSHMESITPAVLSAVGYNYSVPLDKWNIGDLACDAVYVGAKEVDFELPGTLRLIEDSNVWKNRPRREHVLPLFNRDEFFQEGGSVGSVCLVNTRTEDLDESLVQMLKNTANAVLVLSSDNKHRMPAMRRALCTLIGSGVNNPVVIRREFNDLDADRLLLRAATDAGALLLDGMGDGLWLSGGAQVSHRSLNSFSFGILQATRTRISRTEYISCPSCGRTLFDLQETTAMIRSRTDHLKGVKIGIMGCIVNGPGEMADADYGYVGSGPGRITLYRGQNVVRKNVVTEEAVDALIDLIREDGVWVEPVVEGIS